MEKKGFLIAIEGIDGAGKRTLSSAMRAFLESEKFEIVNFAYPDYTSKWGKIIDDFLHNKIELNTNEQFFVYFIDLLNDQNKINNLLDSGKIVITDRYFSSTVAFQCAKGFNYQKALAIMKTMDVIEPDLTLFVQIPSDLAAIRKFEQKKSLDRHESDMKLLQDVDAIYENMLNEGVLSKKWVKIDGSQDLNNVKNTVINILKDSIV